MLHLRCLAVSMLGIAVPAFATQIHPSTGSTTRETRSVAAFDGIRCGSAFVVDFKTGPRRSVVAEGPRALLSRTRIFVRGGLLTAVLDGEGATKRTVKIYVTNPVLTSAGFAGASTGHLANVACRTFRLQATGSSQVDFSGRISDLMLVCAGSSVVKLSSLRLNFADVRLQGASQIAFSGTTPKIAVRASGASTADLSALRVGTANVVAEGASQVSVAVRDVLVADASGASTISYRGSPRVQRTVSGASHIGTM